MAGLDAPVKRCGTLHRYRAPRGIGQGRQRRLCLGQPEGHVHDIAELAESATGRLCRVLGGGTFSRSSPFGHWYEDVRALGFLRPPWGLAYDNLFTASLAVLA